MGSMSNDDNTILLNGEQLAALPEGLYIPEQAMNVVLGAFSGPLDLLWHLIKKENIDILDIPIAPIAKQYAKYIELMQQLELDSVADYLVMAAMLAEIKSKMLLPKPKLVTSEEDPRAELVKKLQEYQTFKLAAEQLDSRPRQERDIFQATAKLYNIEVPSKQIAVSLDDLVSAFETIALRTKVQHKHTITSEKLSVREKMVYILDKISTIAYTKLEHIVNVTEGRHGIIVSFIAILELIKQNLVQLVQEQPLAPIGVKKV